MPGREHSLGQAARASGSIAAMAPSRRCVRLRAACRDDRHGAPCIALECGYGRVGSSAASLSSGWVTLDRWCGELVGCVVVISCETEEGGMLYAFGFERVGVVMGELYFVDPNPLPG